MSSYALSASCGRLRKTRITLAFAALALGSASGPLFADQPDPATVSEENPAAALNAVVVTAQKYKQNIQNVPITMAVVSSDTIALANIVGFKGWGDTIPGLQIEQGADANRRAGPTATIRGVTQTGAGQETEVSAQATTSYTFGDVPINSGDPALFDMNRIEVLKGPQGALFGLASMGGTIRYIPNDANASRFSAELDGGGGEIWHGGTQHNFQGMINLPIIKDVLAVRVAAETVDQDGFVNVHILPLNDNNPKNIFVTGNGASGFTPAPVAQGDIPDANANTLSAARLTATYTPTENLTVRTVGMIQSQDQAQKQNIDYNASGWSAYRFALEPQSNNFRLFSVDGEYRMRFGTFHYIFGTQYRGQTEVDDLTSDASAFLSGAVPALQVNPNLPEDPIPSAVSFPFFSQNKTTSNEVRLQGDHEPLFGSVTYDYLVGLFTMTEHASGNWSIADPTWNVDKGPNTVPILTAGGLILGQNGFGDFKTNAIFADLTFNLTQKLSVGGGARFSRDTFSSAEYSWGDGYVGLAANGGTVGDNLSAPGVPSMVGTIRQSNVTPRAIVSYQIDPDRMLYLDAGKGQRLPETLPDPTYWDVNDQPNCAAIAKQLGVYNAALDGTKSDTVWSYDLGLKSAWLDHRLILDAALYDVRWTAMQLNVHLSEFTTACNNIINANVGDVESKGVEFTGKYAPIDSVILGTSFAYDDAGLSSNAAGVLSSVGTPLLKGDTVTPTPPWQANVNAQYQFAAPYIDAHGAGDAKGYVYVDWRYVGQRFDDVLGNRDTLTEREPFFVAESYSLADLRLGVTTAGWAASVYCTNVLDRRAMYASYVESWFPNQRIVSVSQPRTVGFDINLYF